MIFSQPLPFSEAWHRLQSLGLLPTHLGSADIRDQWDAELRERSLFSARMTKAQILEGYREEIGDLLEGRTNIATARARMQDRFDSLAFDPLQGGFPDEEGEPMEPGSLKDHSSEDRIDLVLRTNMAQVANFADTQRAMGDTALYRYPAWELTRVESRLVPRGLRRAKGGALVPDAGKDWPSRWEKCDGQFFDGHMIALKDDPIWDAIGSSGNFPDALDTSYPPYAFNSGFGRREVSRRECELLGLIGGENAPRPVDVRMNERLAASIKGIPTADIEAIIKGLDAEIEGHKLKLKSQGYDHATRKQEATAK